MKSTVKIILMILTLILIPVALFEYFVLFWCWAGDGVFMLISVPAFFLVYFLIQLFFCIRLKERFAVKTGLIYSMVMLTPVLSVCSSFLLAWVCGIQVNIW